MARKSPHPSLVSSLFVPFVIFCLRGFIIFLGEIVKNVY